MVGTSNQSRRSVLKTLGAGAAGLAATSGTVVANHDYESLSVWIYWAEGTGNYGFSSKPSTLVQAAEDAVYHMDNSVDFNVYSYSGGSVDPGHEWTFEDLDHKTSPYDSVDYGDLIQTFEDNIYLGSDNISNVLIYNSDPEDNAKTGVAKRVVKEGTKAPVALVGESTREVSLKAFKNTVNQEIGHNLNSEHNDGQVYPLGGDYSGASPMITWYTGYYSSQTASHMCDGNEADSTYQHARPLSSCAKDQFNYWMKWKYDG
jgi:hypothetical protein